MSDSMGASSGLRRQTKLGKKAEKFPPNESFLPDDVVIDILSRLPAKYVLRCRCVCRRWRDITSTDDFTDLHIRRSSPMILKDSNGLILLDRCWEPGQTRSKIHKIYTPYHQGIILSHNGLIVADGRYMDCVFIIYNPIYRDHVVKINFPRVLYKGRVCGVFFHPLKKEYCILWEKILSLEPCRVQFRILNLESNPEWRDICIQEVTMKGDIDPVLINDKYVYWMVKPCQHFENFTFDCEIMEYDIIKEEFRVIPFPVRVKDYDINVNLVDKEGVLSLIHVVWSAESVEINIWTLNGDDEEQPWTRSKYVVRNDIYTGYRVPKAIAYWNGELVLELNERLDGRLYVCNLEFGTFRKFGQKYKPWVKFWPHVASLVSLKNCKSNICMEEEEEL